ncbi:MAG: DUF2490 domain-containing protein [Bacteroidales bacterium]|nr:DUF2490 domain-containing protein [Bacteroidales bacterium]
MKTKKFFSLLFSFLLFPTLSLWAQSYDGGLIVDLGFEQKFVKDFSFNLGAEGRMDHWCTAFDRLKLDGTFDYSFLKKKRLKVSLGACYILHNEKGAPEHRGRVHGGLTYTEKIHHFKMAYRIRVQSTFYDVRFGEFKHNPKTYLRNRLYFGYTWKDKGITLHGSTEFFLRLYEPKNCFVDNFRTVLGCDFKLNEKNTLGVYLRADNEIQVEHRDNIFYLGVKYAFENPSKK